MAKLGTKQRPAIVRVRTEARAQEIATIFTKHGWQFIVGVEPDKPENISDRNRLLKLQQSSKAKGTGNQIASAKARKLHSRRKNNPPLRAVRAGETKPKPSVDAIKISEETYEYAPKIDSAKLPAIISCALSVFFLVKFLTTMSLWYVVLFIVPFFCSLGLLNAIILNQRVILHGNTITILRRMQKPITANIADAMYQIRVIHGAIFSFIFRFDNGRRVARITPSAYKNGDKLLQQLAYIVGQENIDVDIIEK
jgi:hypothetical protein